MEFKTSGTHLYEAEKKIFEKLIDFKVPIIFIINKTPPTPKTTKKKINFENMKNNIKNVI